MRLDVRLHNRFCIVLLHPLFDCSTTVDVGAVIESAGFRLLEDMKAVALAVSGTRKVACVVSNIVVVHIQMQIRKSGE